MIILEDLFLQGTVAAIHCPSLVSQEVCGSLGSRNLDVAVRQLKFLRLSYCCPLLLFCIDTSSTAKGNPDCVKGDSQPCGLRAMVSPESFQQREQSS